jgi:hypothetical protein
MNGVPEAKLVYCFRYKALNRDASDSLFDST